MVSPCLLSLRAIFEIDYKESSLNRSCLNLNFDCLDDANLMQQIFITYSNRGKLNIASFFLAHQVASYVCIIKKYTCCDVKSHQNLLKQCVCNMCQVVVTLQFVTGSDLLCLLKRFLNDDESIDLLSAQIG